MQQILLHIKLEIVTYHLIRDGHNNTKNIILRISLVSTLAVVALMVFIMPVHGYPNVVNLPTVFLFVMIVSE